MLRRLKKLGINIRGRSHILRINYRTTEQIRRFADGLLPNVSDDFDEDDDFDEEFDDDFEEEIVGEYTAESRAKTRDIRMLDDGNFLVNGTVSVRTLNRNMDWHLPEHEASTLNGLLLEKLGDIPYGKASIKVGPHIMTVLEIKDNMIGKVLVKPQRARTRA